MEAGPEDCVVSKRGGGLEAASSKPEVGLEGRWWGRCEEVAVLADGVMARRHGKAWQRRYPEATQAAR